MLPVVHCDDTVREVDNLKLSLASRRRYVVETEHVVGEGEHELADVWHYGDACDPSQFGCLPFI